MYINKLSVGALQTNCYIIADKNTNNAAVIDPGGDCRRILNELKMHSHTLQYIIITHSHFDHIAALDELAAATGAKVIISSTDAATLGSSEYTLASALGGRAPVTQPDIRVDDGDTLTIAGSKARFIMTPGHTPGSMCVYFEEQKLLFSGDTLFYESIGRTDFPGAATAQLPLQSKTNCMP